jgi:hypothetical protein
MLVRVGGGGVIDMMEPMEERKDWTLALGLSLEASMFGGAEDSTHSSSLDMPVEDGTFEPSSSSTGGGTGGSLPSLMVTSALLMVRK